MPTGNKKRDINELRRQAQLSDYFSSKAASLLGEEQDFLEPSVAR